MDLELVVEVGANQLSVGSDLDQLELLSATWESVGESCGILNGSFQNSGIGAFYFPSSDFVFKPNRETCRTTYSIEKGENVFFFFLRLHLRYLEVPGLGVESEAQLPTYTTAKPHWI